MHEQDGDNEPAHHARRPMNAFLIFCKRHRSVVRDKYPNLENRSITKILGEWWANLDKEEKACYTGLAKQYKDAFFSANPDFKWYKLPAPPLRTLSSRPREPTDRNELSTIVYHDAELEKTNNNSTKVDLNKPVDHVYENEPKPLSMFTPGKLADEAQMGGLSSLLATKTEIQTPNPYYSPHSCNFKPISASNNDRSHPIIERAKAKELAREDTIRELQNALSETTRMFKEEFDEDQGTLYYYEVSNDQLTNQDVINQIVDKRYCNDDDCQRDSSDDEKNLRSGRSCKGKRYQEFMAVGGLIVNKRQKRDYADRPLDENYSASCSWERGNSPSEESVITDDSKQGYLYSTAADIDIKAEIAETSEPDNNANKTFKAADFDLDAKIRALPSLSLEKFQQKKRENKRKKKTINLKPKGLESPLINSVPRPKVDDRRDVSDNWRDTMIGSQKRKPRKVSITRLEINSMVSSDFNVAHQISPEIKFGTEAPCTVVHSMQPFHSHVDLLALATLAEVASHTSRIEHTALPEHGAAASEENASKVSNTT